MNKIYSAGPYTEKLFGRDVDLEPYDLTKIMKTNSIEFNTERQITVIHGANDGKTDPKVPKTNPQLRFESPTLVSNFGK